ncbi:hypothetical protein CSHISOI_06319, partial [Colletotrichum shisoi]
WQPYCRREGITIDVQTGSPVAVRLAALLLSDWQPYYRRNGITVDQPYCRCEGITIAVAKASLLPSQRHHYCRREGITIDVQTGSPRGMYSSRQLLGRHHPLASLSVTLSPNTTIPPSSSRCSMALPASASAPSSPSNTPTALPMGTQSPASSPVMILLAEPGLRIRHTRPSRLHRPHGADGVTLVNVHGVPASVQ